MEKYLSILKINFHKYQQIENFIIKKEFYYKILNQYPKTTEIKLINFPEKHKENIMFAHEQGSAMKFLFDDNSPNVKIKDDNHTYNYEIKLLFIKIFDKKIIYEIIK